MLQRLPCLLFAVLAPLLLTGGWQCYYSSDDDDRDRIFINEDNNRFIVDNEITVVVSSRKQQRVPIEGLWVVFNDGRNRTNATGRVEIPRRGRNEFYIGDIPLGSSSVSSGSISVEQITGQEAENSAVPINVLRLLLSLDRFRSDNRITIPVSVSDLATLTDPATATVIESLNFADTQAFDNTAANLVALLTGDYPFTVELIDVATAEEFL